MSLSDEEKSVLKNLHVEKADLFLLQADEMCALHHWDLAINRYYYACFHALHALFLEYGFSAHTHEGLIILFGREFVQTGKIDRQYGRFLSRMEQLRKLADYNCTTSVSEEEAHELAQPAHGLVNEIKKMLK